MHANDPIPLVVSLIGLLSSVILYLSAVPVVRHILASKNVLHYKYEPFVIGLVYSVAKAPYPILRYQIGPIVSSAASLLLYSIYYAIYVSHVTAESRIKIYVALSKALACTVFIEAIGPLIFWFTLDPNDALRMMEIWFGTLSTVAVVLLMSNQLAAIRQVVREKDSKYISGWMLSGNIFCATCWSVYSVLIMDPFYLAANAVGDIACLAQLVAKLCYQNSETSVSKFSESSS